jgi:hypothetical protein
MMRAGVWRVLFGAEPPRVPMETGWRAGLRGRRSKRGRNLSVARTGVRTFHRNGSHG